MGNSPTTSEALRPLPRLVPAFNSFSTFVHRKCGIPSPVQGVQRTADVQRHLELLPSVTQPPAGRARPRAVIKLTARVGSTTWETQLIATWNNRPAPFMWPGSRLHKAAVQPTAKCGFRRIPAPLQPKACPPPRLDAADADLVTGTCNLIRVCGLGSLSVAIRSALDGPADAAWAAARALN